MGRPEVVGAVPLTRRRDNRQGRVNNISALADRSHRQFLN